MTENAGHISKRAYRDDLQGLRGLAIIAVLLFHFRVGGVNGGFLGVDIFFVLSGFLITGILQRHKNSLQTLELFSFYAKRFWRIFPAYIITILVSLAAGWYFLLPEDLARLGVSAGYSGLFVSNFFFFKEAGYFDLSGIFKPLLHTWSLAVEMQFYLVWPFLLAALSSLKNTSPARSLVIFFILMLIGSTFLSMGDAENAFFMMYSRLWEFAIGALVAVSLENDDEIRPTLLANIAGSAALLALVTSVFVISHDMTLPAPGALVPVIATASLIYLGAKSRWTHTLLCAPPLKWIGEISYSLYLVHWPIIVYLSYVLYPEPSGFAKALALLASLALALALYMLVEVPFRDRGKKQPFSLARVGIASIFLGGVLLVSLVTTNSAGAPARFAPTVLEQIAATELHPPHTKAATSKNPENPATRKLALWGDSHAQHFKGEIATRARAAGFHMNTYNSSGCPPIVDLYLKRHSLTAPKRCGGKNRRALIAILQDDKVETVVLAARWAYYAETRRFAGEAGGRAFLTRSKWALVSVPQSRRNFASGLQRTVDQLVRAGKRVILLGQVPEFGFDPPRCIKMSIITRTSNEVCKIDLDQVFERQKFAEYVMNKIATGSDMVSYVRTSKGFCNATSCSPLLNGKLAYHDDDHINALGAKKALQDLRLKSPVKTPVKNR